MRTFNKYSKTTFFLIIFLFFSLLPTNTVFAASLAKIAAGLRHTIALKNNGTVWAWGYNYQGQLGDGTNTNSSLPVQVTGLSNIIAVAGGGEHTIALKDDGTVWAWGNNKYGQLGDGTTTYSSTPVQVTGLSNVIAVAGGGEHIIALKDDGTVWAWGKNKYGQLGDGTNTDQYTPVQVTGLSNVIAVAGGGKHTIALKNNGTVWAWGYNNDGELGDGTTTHSSTPVQVTGLSNVISVAGGLRYTIALKNNGTVRAWGYNSKGQLGDGTNTDQYTPVQVTGLSDVIAIAGGSYHTIALKNDGTTWAWGYNSDGELGDGTTTHSSTPVQVTGLSDVIAIAGGLYHTIALKNDGTVWAWGDNNKYGQLGDGTNTDQYTPVEVFTVSDNGEDDNEKPISNTYNLTQTQVSQLYVSIFGRASEGEGSSYWRADYYDMVLAAETMLDTDAAKTYFGDTLNNNQKFIEFIYENTLGKTYSEDPDGVNYWVAQLEHGNSKGVVIISLISAVMDSQYLGSTAQNRFKNKVTVCNHTADTITSVPDANDLSAFVGFISDVTDESTTVTSAKDDVNTFAEKEPPLSPTVVSATDGTYTDKVKITWNSSNGATSYEVWQNKSNSTSSASKIGTTTRTYYYDKSGTAGTKDYYWVKAVNSSGASGFSSYNTGYKKTDDTSDNSTDASELLKQVAGAYHGYLYNATWSASYHTYLTDPYGILFRSSGEWIAVYKNKIENTYLLKEYDEKANGEYYVSDGMVIDTEGQFELKIDEEGNLKVTRAYGYWNLGVSDDPVLILEKE